MWFLYNQSKSCVCIPHTESNLFTAYVGPCQGCHLSLILFVIFMDRISRRSRGEEGVWFGNIRVAPLPFADDVVLLASSSQGLQRALERFADLANPRPWFITWKGWNALIWVGDESLPQAEEFKCLGILFTSDGRLEKEMDIRTGALPAVITGLLWSVLVKRELRREGEAFNLLVHHFYNPHLWSRDVGRERQDKTADTSGLNGFPSENGRTYP